jgi:hypothetical protein
VRSVSVVALHLVIAGLCLEDEEEESGGEEAGDLDHSKWKWLVSCPGLDSMGVNVG